MNSSTKIQEIRIQNLRKLHARPSDTGSPTSEFLVRFLTNRGVKINKSGLSEIYWKKSPISDYLASELERAFDLPAGWLSEDNEFLYKLNPSQLIAFRTLISLPIDINLSIISLIEKIVEQQVTHSKSKPIL
mgnify:CR=1 FL=1